MLAPCVGTSATWERSLHWGRIACLEKFNIKQWALIYRDYSRAKVTAWKRAVTFQGFPPYNSNRAITSKRSSPQEWNCEGSRRSETKLATKRFGCISTLSRSAIKRDLQASRGAFIRSKASRVVSWVTLWGNQRNLKWARIKAGVRKKNP